MWIGADVSKGFIDVLAMDTSGTLGTLRRFDDTPSGHQAWCVCQKTTHICVGVESTGERNWVRSCARWRGNRPASKLRCVVDPRAVHRLAKSLPARCKTDPSSARAIATYLKLMENELKQQPLPPPERGFFRSLMTMQHMAAKMINQIKSFLPEVQPNLALRPAPAGPCLGVSGTQKNIRRREARTSTRCKVNDEARARHLIEQAKLSTSALDDDSLKNICVRW